MSPQRRMGWATMHVPGQSPHRVYIDLITEDAIKRVLAEKRWMTFTPTVRITFERSLGVFRVDEMVGPWRMVEVSGWTIESVAESLAKYHAAARGLPISRVDLPQGGPNDHATDDMINAYAARAARRLGLPTWSSELTEARLERARREEQS
jgi:hypothetical protein